MLFLSGDGERERMLFFSILQGMPSKHMNIKLTLLWDHLTQLASS